MNDPEMTRLTQKLRDFADERDWNQFHDPKNLSMALVVEAGELVEIFQWLTSEQATSIMGDPKKAGAVKEELADVYGYLLRLADILGVSLNEALESKIEVNTEKYPVEQARGNATRYDELHDPANIREPPLGLDGGPDYLGHAVDVANRIGELGRAGEAAKFLRGLVEDADRTYGRGHSSSNQAWDTVAYWLWEAGAKDEAISVIKDLLHSLREIYGDTHESVLATRCNLIWREGVYRDRDEVTMDFQVLLEDSRQARGESAPLTQLVRQRYASWLSEVGYHAQAKIEFENILDSRLKSLNPNDPEILRTEFDLALELEALGDFDGALSKMASSLASQPWPPSHPEVLRAKSEYSWSLRAAGKFDDAAAELRALALDREESFGPHDRTTLETLGFLAITLADGGHREQAVNQLYEVLDAQIRAFGSEDPDTLTTRQRLVEYLSQLGRQVE